MKIQKLIDELNSQEITLCWDGRNIKWTAPFTYTPDDEIKALIKKHWLEIIKRIDGPRPDWLISGTSAIKLTDRDCLDAMGESPGNLVDLIVTDPPYGYEFMGKDWDKAVPRVQIWKECLRVLKPGGFAFIMSAPRQDVLSRMITNLELAGFRTGFTSLYWTYASGFPKAYNISKAIDKKAGVERADLADLNGSYAGYQPKPAVEVILIVQKPLSEKTYTNQALSNRKGVTWLDDCSIPYPADEKLPSTGDRTCNFGEQETVSGGKYGLGWEADEKGRFPANLLISDNALGDCHSRYFSLDAWAERDLPFLIVPKASRKEKNYGLDNLKNHRLGDKGNGIGRVCEKCGAPQLNPCDCEPKSWIHPKRKNYHPTVKPIQLMSFLITLGSREGDIVLDPFCGSGTTCLAARFLKRPVIGIEKNHDYFEIANAKIKALNLAQCREYLKSDAASGSSGS